MALFVLHSSMKFANILPFLQTTQPTPTPTEFPTRSPSLVPTISPTSSPTDFPTISPTESPVSDACFLSKAERFLCLFTNFSTFFMLNFFSFRWQTLEPTISPTESPVSDTCFCVHANYISFILLTRLRFVLFCTSTSYC